MMKYIKSPRTWIIAGFLAGLSLTMLGWTWSAQELPQTVLFNQGMVAYNSGNYDIAVQAFDRSLNEYQNGGKSSNKPSAADNFQPAPSLVQAADAQFYKFMALLKMKNAKLALIAVKEALKLTTDENLSHYALSPAQVSEIKEQRIVYQTDLEILFKQKKEMQDGEGKGKPGEGQPKPGDKQSEDPSSGQQAGKTPRDSL